MNIVFEKFARRIIVEMHPSKFTFRDAKGDSVFSVETFLYLDNSGTKSSVISIGEPAPEKYKNKPDIYRVDVFSTDNSFPPKGTVNRGDLVQIIFQYGLFWFYRRDFIPLLRPIVFILGASRFDDFFVNPKDELKTAAKKGGAFEVFFDKTEL